MKQFQTNIPIIDNGKFIQLHWDTKDKKINTVTTELLSSLKFQKRKDAMQNLHKHLRTILINFTRILRVDEEISLISPRNNNFLTNGYKAKIIVKNPYLYNNKKLIEVFDALKKYKYIECHKGDQDYYNDEYLLIATRYKMNQKLLDFIKMHELTNIRFTQKPINKGIIIKEKDAGDRNVIIKNYNKKDDTQEIKETKKWLPQYNNIIQAADIALTHIDNNQNIYFDEKLTDRHFCRDLDYHGRFYGGWWTTCKSENRKHISIDGEQTVECDFKANHLNLFYGINEQKMDENLQHDPYALDLNLDRSIFKFLINRMFAFKDDRGLIKHINGIVSEKKKVKAKELELCKNHFDTEDRIKEAIAIIYEAHPIMKKAKDRNLSSKLMYQESKISAFVMREMTDMDIPVLNIHDSFIVQEGMEDILKEQMTLAYASFFTVAFCPKITTTRIDNDLITSS